MELGDMEVVGEAGSEGEAAKGAGSASNGEDVVGVEFPAVQVGAGVEEQGGVKEAEEKCEEATRDLEEVQKHRSGKHQQAPKQKRQQREQMPPQEAGAGRSGNSCVGWMPMAEEVTSEHQSRRRISSEPRSWPQRPLLQEEDQEELSETFYDARQQQQRVREAQYYQQPQHQQQLLKEQTVQDLLRQVRREEREQRRRQRQLSAAGRRQPLLRVTLDAHPDTLHMIIPYITW
jgi:hypothetical protein